MTKIDDAATTAPLATETIVTGRAPRTRRRSPFRRPIASIVRHALLIALALAMLYPVIWMVVSSLRPNDEIFRDPSIIPDSFEVSNYVDGWSALAYPFNVYMWNSAVIVLGCIIGNLVSCSMAAYAFARLQFSGKRFWFAVMLLSIMLPIHVIIVPQYVLFSQLGWINTFLPLIVPSFFGGGPFYIFLLRQFFLSIPRDLDEAAKIDGASSFQIFWWIMLPLSKVALATVAIFSFIEHWNEFIGPLIYLNSTNLFPVSIGLRYFLASTFTGDEPRDAILMAASLIVALPPLILFFVAQKYFVEGIATTGIKG
jgi:multiple sugar transport system permease protein